MVAKERVPKAKMNVPFNPSVGPVGPVQKMATVPQGLVPGTIPTFTSSKPLYQQQILWADPSQRFSQLMQSRGTVQETV